MPKERVEGETGYGSLDGTLRTLFAGLHEQQQIETAERNLPEAKQVEIQQWPVTHYMETMSGSTLEPTKYPQQ